MTMVEGGVAWRHAAGELELSAARNGASTSMRVQARGALLMAGGEILAAPRLDYAFALVDVLSDAEAALTFENRPVARRAGNGKRAIITGLQPYAANRIGVDLDALPIDTLVTSPEQLAVPGYRQAVRISFGSASVRPATLQLVDGTGTPLPIGLAVSGADGSPGVTGQDGEIYLPDAHPGQQISVQGTETACQAVVPPLPEGVGLPRLGAVPCVTLKEE
jgi:outer membrane usher protein